MCFAFFGDKIHLQGKKSMSETRYLIFPVQFFEKTAVKEICSLAFHYGIYRKALDYLEEGESGVTIDHIKQAMKYFNLQVNDLENRLKHGKYFYELHGENIPVTSINVLILIQYGKEDKTEFEVLVFRAYCAIRGILGTKAYMRLTNDYWVARMYGFRKVSDYLVHQEKYALKRYTLDKIKNELQNNWGLIYYSNKTRGFFVSYTLSLVDLMVHVESNKLVSKDAELKKKKQEAYEAALKRLKK